MTAFEIIHSFDPGATTGVAVGDNMGNLKELHTLVGLDLFDYLIGLQVADRFIIESFKIRPNKASSFIWSDMTVIQYIGAIAYRAYELKIPCVMQEPSIKPMGYRWAGIEVPKTHSLSHETDAYAHLCYYWVKELKLEAPSIKKLKEQRRAQEAK